MQNKQQLPCLADRTHHKESRAEQREKIIHKLWLCWRWLSSSQLVSQSALTLTYTRRCLATKRPAIEEKREEKKKTSGNEGQLLPWSTAAATEVTAARSVAGADTAPYALRRRRQSSPWWWSPCTTVSGRRLTATNIDREKEKAWPGPARPRYGPRNGPVVISFERKERKSVSRW